MKNIARYFSGKGWAYYKWQPWEYPLDVWRDFRAFLQRGWRGYADCDVWELRDYLAAVIVGAVDQLRWESHGYPGVPGADSPEEWEMVLMRIANGFSASLKMQDGDWAAEEIKELVAQEQRGRELFAKWFADLWD